MRGEKWTESDEIWLKKHFSDTKTADLAQKLGCSVTRIEKYAYTRGLRKSDEYTEAARMMALRKAKQANLARVYDNSKSAEALRKRIRHERARIAFGLEQKTKLHLIRQARPKILLRSRLRKAGYIIDDEERIAYWTDTTQRKLKTEKWNTRWYAFARLPESSRSVNGKGIGKEIPLTENCVDSYLR